MIKNKEAVTQYVSRGYAVVPVPARTKGPKIPKWHVTEFVADHFHPNDNVGIVLGERSGGLVDVDLDSPEAVALAPYLLPETAMIHGRTGKPRSHYWYVVDNAPREIEQFDSPDGMIVELRSGSLDKGAQTVVPPSVHVSGEHIEWAEDGEPARVELDVLRTAVKRIASATRLVRMFPATGRHAFCLALSGGLLRGGLTPKEAHAFVLAVATAAGSADPVARAAVVYSTASKLDAGENVTGWPALRAMIPDGLGNVAAFDTAIELLDMKRSEKVGSEGPYSDADIAGFAKTCGLTTEQYMASLLVFDGRSSTLYVRDGETFRRPITKQHAEKALEQFLGAYPLKWVDDEGKPVPVSVLVKRHSSLADDVKASFAAPRSAYDPVQARFTERLAPQRAIVPKFDERIDRWLRLLGGPNAERLLDWLASVTRLEDQCCALYLCGAAGAGKGMLAAGLARIWREGKPVALDEVMGAFQDDLAKCPLIFADEALSDKNSSAKLRSLIGTSSISLNRKHLSSIPIEGAIRIMIAGNNDGLLSFDEILTDRDIEAVGVRFLKVDVSDEPRTYLESLGGLDTTTQWVSGDGIAAHVLELARTRVVARGKRFLVDGNTKEVGDLIRKHSKVEQLVLGVVLDALQGDAVPCQCPIYVDAENGLWVHAKRVFQALTRPETGLKRGEAEVVTAVANVCEGERKHCWFPDDSKKQRLRARKINMETLTEWADRVRGIAKDVLEKLIIDASKAHSSVKQEDEKAA